MKTGSTSTVPVVTSGDEDVKEIRALVKLKNNRLIRLREQMGWGAREAAEKVGISYNRLLALEAMGVSPLSHKNRESVWTKPALTICAFYGVDPEYLWSEAVRSVKKNVGVLEIGGADIELFFAHTKDSLQLVEDGIDFQKIEHLLKKVLTPREEYVLRAHCGVGVEEKTLDRIGEDIGLDGETIRTTRNAALWKMRYALRSPSAREDFR